MSAKKLNLLSLEGDVAQAFSSLLIIERLMKEVSPDHPPRPCDYFDMIGGNGAGGLIAIMLGRLRMDIDDAIRSFRGFVEEIRWEKEQFNSNFEGNEMREWEREVRWMIRSAGFSYTQPLYEDDDPRCKVFVGATEPDTSEKIVLSSYEIPHRQSISIREAVRAIMAAPSFSKSFNINSRVLEDGGLEPYDPVRQLILEARRSIPEARNENYNCIVYVGSESSTGTGRTRQTPFGTGVTDILKDLVSFGSITASMFEAELRDHKDNSVYFRFCVERLDEHDLRHGMSVVGYLTKMYLDSPEVMKSYRTCGQRLRDRNSSSEAGRKAGSFSTNVDNEAKIVAEKSSITSFRKVSNLLPIVTDQHPIPTPPLGSEHSSPGRSLKIIGSELMRDTESIQSDNEYVKMEDEVKAQIISAFATELSGDLEDILEEYPLSSYRFRDIVIKALKNFAIELKLEAKPGLQRDTTILVQRCRRKSSRLTFLGQRQIVNRCQVLLRLSQELNQRPQAPESAIELTASEKIDIWTAEESDEKKEENPSEHEDNEDDRRPSSSPNIDEAWHFLIQRKPYRLLLHRVQSAISMTPRSGTMIDEIESVILGILSSQTESLLNSKPSFRKCAFSIGWNPVAFIQEQYPLNINQQLGEVITLIGLNSDAQAITCAKYLDQMWPGTGGETLQALQRAITRRLYDKNSEPLETRFTNGTEIKIVLGHSTVEVTAYGLDHIVVELGEQLYWLGAACRTSDLTYNTSAKPLYNKTKTITIHQKIIARCFGSIENHISVPRVVTDLSSPEPVCSFSVDYRLAAVTLENKYSDQDASCWHPLFYNPVIVEGYPIRNRSHDERGLEVSLSMMASLGLTDRVTVFDNHVVIKGFSSMFVPTKRAGSSVQWHYLYNEDEKSRLSYLEAEAQCPERLSIKDLDPHFLPQSRNFVGWASSVSVLIGTKDIDYNKITYTGANFSSLGCALEKVSITAGMHVNLGGVFGKGNKDTSPFLRRSSTYSFELNHAKKMSVVLYDKKDGRGWLVDGTKALLHLACCQLNTSPCNESEFFKISDFHYAEQSDGMDAAYRTLGKKRNLELILSKEVKIEDVSVTQADGEEKKEIKRTETRYCFQDLVQETWHVLEQILDHQTKLIAAPGIGLRVTDRDILEGWGFRDIVEGENPLLPRFVTLKSNGRGWVDFTKKINAVTLIGTGFGDLIKPAEGANVLCESWKLVPKGQDYLVACTELLQRICTKGGNEDARPLELYQGVYWHKGTKPFEPCSGCKMNWWGATCDRVQVLLPPSLGHKTYPNPFKHKEGAIVFGRSANYNWDWGNTGDPVRADIAETGEEVERVPTDSGIGTSINTGSGLNPEGSQTASSAAQLAESSIYEFPEGQQTSKPQVQGQAGDIVSGDLYGVDDDIQEALDVPKIVPIVSGQTGESTRSTIVVLPRVGLTGNESTHAHRPAVESASGTAQKEGPAKQDHTQQTTELTKSPVRKARNWFKSLLPTRSKDK